jgi:chromosome segregation protein
LQFNKLRLTGFKSFVDATELEIAPGMTGIVGPNGCGKSNLVEALRWVMGETSAKQMRGGEMNDVIFGGTSDRPARNVAEVSLLLDNASRTAPPQFNESEELEVSRRIERDKGSTYRVNGSELRARDVQVLFADQATGPRSTALVSQGRVGALINARPVDRRHLLEEAAGITGLHSRRHEAELRLRAAETNLERLDDVLTTLDAQLQGLKKQARQAKRYRNLSELIRQSEAVVLHQRWTAASAETSAAREALHAAETIVVEHARAVALANNARENAAEAVPPLRHAEAGAAAELQRLTMARNELDAEEKRVAEAMTQAETRLQQIAGDIEREGTLSQDANAALDRLGTERREIEAANAGEAGMIAEAAQTLEAARETAGTLEAQLTALTERIASDEARMAALKREIGELTTRDERMRDQFNNAVAERDALQAEGVDPAGIRAAEAALAEAEATLSAARGALDAAEQARADADAERDRRREARHEAEAERSRLRAETEALEELLAAAPDDIDWTPVLDRLEVAEGFETALGAALGDDLVAADDESKARHWKALPPDANAAALPAGAAPLADFVRGVPALARRLVQIGVVDDAATAARLSPALATGQRLVTRDGGLWRWDGFTVAAGDSTAAAARLRQRNRLDALRGELAAAETRWDEADRTFATTRDAAEAAATAERAAREAQREADRTIEQARTTHGELSREAVAKASRLENLREAVLRLEGELADIDGRLGERRGALVEIGDLDGARSDAEAARGRLAEARNALHAAQAAHDRLVREGQERRRRIEAIAAEEGSWNARARGTAERIAELEARRTAAQEELACLATRPAEIAQARNGLMTTLGEAEAKRGAAADRVAEAETALAAADKALRDVEALHNEAREARVRAESAVAQTEQLQTAVRERIAERLSCRPEGARALTGLAEDKELPPLDAAEAKLERLQRERENMGPVNLRAEQEAEELEEQIATIHSERDDLIGAIGRLRQGISSLNREARQRLLTSFKEVDQHFQQLFVRLFGGGRAHLELTESDDPLEAGLEIFAQPPGKKLQALSLLSGGEQALTATALLFAVFLTNPAPICVLDEVDAPLDDANVDRFCTLLDEIARQSNTRFLLVTHHRMTMARMDRLYGVTMPERGVSQLVSVDLSGAEEIRATA